MFGSKGYGVGDLKCQDMATVHPITMTIHLITRIYVSRSSRDHPGISLESIYLFFGESSGCLIADFFVLFLSPTRMYCFRYHTHESYMRGVHSLRSLRMGYFFELL